MAQNFYVGAFHLVSRPFARLGEGETRFICGRKKKLTRKTRRVCIRLFSSCAHTQATANRYHHDPQTGWLDRRWCPVLVAGAGTIAARRSFAEQELKERLVFFDREVPSARPLCALFPAARRDADFWRVQQEQPVVVCQYFFFVLNRDGGSVETNLCVWPSVGGRYLRLS